jgi:hypothetical protein
MREELRCATLSPLDLVCVFSDRDHSIILVGERNKTAYSLSSTLAMHPTGEVKKEKKREKNESNGPELLVSNSLSLFYICSKTPGNVFFLYSTCSV